MKLRELGIGLTIATGFVAGCTVGEDADKETPTAETTTETSANAMPCHGDVGRISLVNTERHEFMVQTIEGSRECNKPPAEAEVFALGSLQYERLAGTLAVGDTFIAVCDLGNTHAALIQSGDREGVVFHSFDADAAFTNAGVQVCNEEQNNRIFGS